VLELVEASLDTVAASVDERIMRDRFRSGAGGGDDHLGADCGDEAAQGIGIIGSVGKNDLSRVARIGAARMSWLWPAASRNLSGRPKL